MNRKELTAAILDHAKAHYEVGGWDSVYECMGEEEIFEQLGQAFTGTLDEAIAIIGEGAGIWDVHRKDIQATAF